MKNILQTCTEGLTPTNDFEVTPFKMLENALLLNSYLLVPCYDEKNPSVGWGNSRSTVYSAFRKIQLRRAATGKPFSVKLSKIH